MVALEPARTTPPDWLYVFVNAANSIAVMNLQITGRYSSAVLAGLADPAFARAYADGTADFLPFVANDALSTGFMSPFAVSTVNNYRVEVDAELARRTYFKDAPSRLTGIYAVESLGDCRELSRRYGWPLHEAQRFKVEHVLRAVRVNMEVVSLARHAYGRAMLDADSLDHLWRSYWSGADAYTMDLPSVDARQRELVSVGALWEWIIDGVLVHESRVGGDS